MWLRRHALSLPATPSEPAAQQHQCDGEDRTTDNNADSPREEEHGEHHADAKKEEPRYLSGHRDLRHVRQRSACRLTNRA